MMKEAGIPGRESGIYKTGTVRSVLEKESQAIVECKCIEKILENRRERFNHETPFANQEACGETLGSGVKGL